MMKIDGQKTVQYSVIGLQEQDRVEKGRRTFQEERRSEMRKRTERAANEPSGAKRNKKSVRAERSEAQ